jgi:nickel/cobalt exporter
MSTGVPEIGLYYLPVAFVLGALHALEPGHGKALASAYLLGGDHDWRDAVALGLSTTLSHTGVVILLAVGGFYAGDALPAHDLAHAFTILGAGLLLGLGALALFRALRALRHPGSHGHSHGHGHDHAHDHAHLPRPVARRFVSAPAPPHRFIRAQPVVPQAAPRRPLRTSVVIGLSNGLLPCPGAMTALVVALYLGRLAEGLATVLVYSLGLASALAGFGVLAIEAGKRARARLPSDRLLRWLPVFSALVILVTGALMLLVPGHHGPGLR